MHLRVLAPIRSTVCARSALRLSNRFGTSARLLLRITILSLLPQEHNDHSYESRPVRKAFCPERVLTAAVMRSSLVTAESPCITHSDRARFGVETGQTGTGGSHIHEIFHKHRECARQRCVDDTQNVFPGESGAMV